MNEQESEEVHMLLNKMTNKELIETRNYIRVLIQARRGVVERILREEEG